MFGEHEVMAYCVWFLLARGLKHIPQLYDSWELAEPVSRYISWERARLLTCRQAANIPVLSYLPNPLFNGNVASTRHF